MKKWRIFLILWLLYQPVGVFAGEGNNFCFAQLRHDGAWDPYPNVPAAILEMVRSYTNIPFSPERKIVSLADESIFEYPFFIVKGNSALKFSPGEKRNLKIFIDRGGTVFFDDTLADRSGDFFKSIRKTLEDLYPGLSFKRLPPDHSLFRSFFLLKNVAGRRISEKFWEGLDVGGQGGGESRTAVIYCPNDLLGAWMRDQLGQYAFTCEPGGEAQRWESFKLTINLIYFGLTGTYKKDAIHQPFIEQKLRY